MLVPVRLDFLKPARQAPSKSSPLAQGLLLKPG